jgi:cobalt/nickel transport system permease protein
MPTPPANRLHAALSHLHPAGKLLGVLALVVAALALPRTGLPRLAGPAGALLLLWLLAGLPVRLLARRLAVALPFVLIAALSLPFMVRPGAHVLTHWGPLPLTREGLTALEAVVAKALFCLLALSLLAAVTSPRDLLAALRALRVPGLLVTTLSLTLRYLSLLEEEALRMMHARDARGVPPALRRRARVAGWMVGSLFLRSWERAERVGQALTARGFTGTLPVVGAPPWRAADFVALALVLAAAVALVIA